MTSSEAIERVALKIKIGNIDLTFMNTVRTNAILVHLLFRDRDTDHFLTIFIL